MHPAWTQRPCVCAEQPAVLRVATRLRVPERQQPRVIQGRAASPFTAEAWTEQAAAVPQLAQPAATAHPAAPAAEHVVCQTLRWNWKWGSSIAYTQAGCASDGRPALLLLHGFGVSRKHFVHNIPALAEHYTVSRYMHTVM